MIRFTTLAVTCAAAITLATTAFADPQLERVRGTVANSSDTSISVKGADGATKDITVTPDTKFVWVVKSSLDQVGEGKFIGTATKGENPPTAIELVIFPDSMKGTAEGHYAWDSIADQTAGSGGKMMAKSAMTNGTIKSAGGAKKLTKSAMTNGTVKAGSESGGGKKITVTYDNGKSLDIVVPPNAPIVAFEPADKSVLTSGGQLFSVNAKEGDKLTAKLVAVGKDGVTPPM